jgi:hypothetical protein
MLLYEIYGKDLFKITRYEIDILRYRPKSVILAAMAGGAGAGAGAYIEDGNHIRDRHNEDVRVDIPSSSAVNDIDAADAADDDDAHSGGRLLAGIKWLFGS